MARPTILTPELQAEVARMLRQGVPIAHAAQAAGCSETTYHAWHERGRNHAESDDCTGTNCTHTDHPYTEFREVTREAKAKAVAQVSARLKEDINRGDVKAITYYLSHADRDNWHPRSRTDSASEGEIEVKLEWPDLQPNGE